MRKLLLGATLLTIAMSSPAETKQALTLHMETGGTIVYFLDMEPVIGFEGQTMIINVGEDSTDIPMADVNQWEIGFVEYSGVEALRGIEKERLTIYGTDVRVNNPDSQNICIYNLGGTIIAKGNQRDSSFTLPRGIYIVTIGNKTYKIAIR